MRAAPGRTVAGDVGHGIGVCSQRRDPHLVPNAKERFRKARSDLLQARIKPTTTKGSVRPPLARGPKRSASLGLFRLFRAGIPVRLGVFLVDRIGGRSHRRRKQRAEERKRLGLQQDPLLDARPDDGLAADERNVADAVAREEAAKKATDPLLRESAAILADAIGLLGKDAQLAAQVLPATRNAAGHWAD